MNGRGKDDEDGFSFRGVRIPRSNISDNGVVCPLCNIVQKRVMSHIKKAHGDDHDDAMEAEFRKYMSKLRQEKSREAKKNRDPSGYAQSEREAREKTRMAKKECDPLGFAATRERELIKKQERQKKVREEEKKRDAESYARKKREEKEIERACQLLQNPELYAETRRKEQELRRQKEKEKGDQDIKRYKKEVKLGPAFPCACCHTYKFRDQVVKLTDKQIAHIEKCAYEAFLKEKAAKQGAGKQRNQLTKEEMEEANRRHHEEMARKRESVDQRRNSRGKQEAL